MNWKANWIHLPEQKRDGSPAPAPYLRKAFTLEEQAAEAIVQVTALALYELWINGAQGR